MTPLTITLGNFCGDQDESVGRPGVSPELLDGSSVESREGDEVSTGSGGGM